MSLHSAILRKGKKVRIVRLKVVTFKVVRKKIHIIFKLFYFVYNGSLLILSRQSGFKDSYVNAFLSYHSFVDYYRNARFLDSLVDLKTVAASQFAYYPS